MVSGMGHETFMAGIFPRGVDSKARGFPDSSWKESTVMSGGKMKCFLAWKHAEREHPSK